MTTDTQHPAAHKLACILATIHTVHLGGDDALAKGLLHELPVALADEDVASVYYSEAVTDYLGEVEYVLYPEGRTLAAEELLAVNKRNAAEFQEVKRSREAQRKSDAEKLLDELSELLFGTEGFPDEEEVTDAFKAPEVLEFVGVCGSPYCGCAPEQEDASEELLAETDEFVIVKIWK